ncbi:MAG: asparaginase, partial [Planctomycetes bacterium]|nr:asparaginase [Planctomycetota bacterium]
MVPTSPCLSVVRRSGLVESAHRGSLVVVRDGVVVFACGDPDSWVYCRSAVKPVQALPLIERGIAERLGLTAQELALVAASHNGTELHTELAMRLLERGGFTPDDLRCGPHSPFDRQAGIRIARGGAKPERIHNNCSGKHAGFLLLAQDMG